MFFLINISQASFAAPVYDTGHITVRVVIPAKLNARIFQPEPGTRQNYSVCIAGSGVGQFRIQNLSFAQDGGGVSSYSRLYPVATDQLQACSSQAATVTLPVPESGQSVVLITAE